MGETYNGIKYARSKAKVSDRTCWLTFAREFATYKCNDVKNRHLHRPFLRTWLLATIVALAFGNFAHKVSPTFIQFGY